MHVMKNEGNLSASSSKSSRHRLTEAEREERNIRRLLANRESASKTNQRRRALHEKLIRSATELAMENQSLKREREQALEDFNSLKRENERLTDMMAEVEKGELNINQGDIETGKAPNVSQQPFYWFLPLQTQDVAQSLEPSQHLHLIDNAQNEECLNLFSTASSSSTPNVILHHSEASDRRHEDGIRFGLEESSNVGNMSHVREFKPTAVHSYGQSSSSSSSVVCPDKKSAATEARRRRKELNKFKYLDSFR